MTTKADWLVVCGFLLSLLGVALRIVMMMRSSDAMSSKHRPAHELLNGYKTVFPKSRLPFAMWGTLGIGLVLMIGGYLLEFR